MGIVKDLTVGQTLKVYEDGTAVEFIVAQHDYEKDLNGKVKGGPAGRHGELGEQPLNRPELCK